MRADYQSYFDQLKKWMDKFGYLSIKEDELSAVFFFANGWKLQFLGEKVYAPMFGIDLIAPPNIGIKRGHEFSREDSTEIIRYDLSFLRYTFERLRGQCYENMPKNIISAAMEFLRREQEAIFEDPRVYEAEHRIVSEMRIEEKNTLIASHQAGIVTSPAIKSPPKEGLPSSLVTP